MEQERDLCHFCKESRPVERTYLYPSKYIKEQGAFVNKYLYNEGDYFIIVKTCADCGTPQLPQQEISDEEIEKVSSTLDYDQISEIVMWENGARWYREQLKFKQPKQ